MKGLGPLRPKTYTYLTENNSENKNARGSKKKT